MGSAGTKVGSGERRHGGFRGVAHWMVAGVPAALLLSPGIQAQEVRSLEGDRVAVLVPAGAVRVEAGSGGAVEVEVRFMGRDAGQLRLEARVLEGRNALLVRYPEGEDIVYPVLRGRTDLTMQRDGSFGGRGGDRIRLSGSGRGVEAWAEVTVRVPRGRDVEIRLGAGDLEAQGVDADLRASTGPGSVRVSGLRGGLEVQVGSGAVTARDIEGAVSLRTGSGTITASALRGSSVRMQTGSGAIEVEGFNAGDVHVQTGSGRIEVEGAASGTLTARTGSGAVSVHLTTSPSDLEVQTGSGGVTLRVPSATGAEVDVRTGSGGIEVDLAASLVTARRGLFRGTLGDGGGRIRINTGSGSVRIRSS